MYSDKAGQWLPGSEVGMGTESKGASGKGSRKTWGSTENFLDLNLVVVSMVHSGHNSLNLTPKMAAIYITYIIIYYICNVNYA